MLKMNYRIDRPDRPDRMDQRRQIDLLESLESFESKFNMYERQIDQLFDFTYKEQDEIKTLFCVKDDLAKHIDMIDQKINAQNAPINSQVNAQVNLQVNELKVCIQNYYHLELENKRRMENIECYQFQLFIFQLIIISYLIYIRFM